MPDSCNAFPNNLCFIEKLQTPAEINAEASTGSSTDSSRAFISDTFNQPAIINLNDYGSVSPDMVNRPAHYTYAGLECIDAIRAICADKDGYEGFCASQVLKYLWRFRKKGNPIEDIRKARYYLNSLIDYESSLSKEAYHAE